MKFILHEVKMWFKKKNEVKSYIFLPNKVNVVTGISTTGKTSFWNIIDYCLLSDKGNIASEVNDRVEWFGIRFTINNKEVVIIRHSKIKGVVSSEIYFGMDDFPDEPYANYSISDLKNFLDAEFGLDDNYKQPLKKIDKKKNLVLSFRHFLIFNSLTQMMIDAPETYFDTTHYGKKEYDEVLPYIFDLAVGIKDIETISACNKIKELEQKIDKIKSSNKRIEKNHARFETDLNVFIDKYKKLNIIDYSESFLDSNLAIDEIKKSFDELDKNVRNEEILEEIDFLNNEKRKLKSKIFSINQYYKEFNLYKLNLEKYADSLQPIYFLKNNLADQLIDTYETKTFIEILDSSLKEIKKNLSIKPQDTLNLSMELEYLKGELSRINSQLDKLTSFQNDFQSNSAKIMSFGEAKSELNNLLNYKPYTISNKTSETEFLNQIEECKKLLENMPQREFRMHTLLDCAIQRNFDLLKSLPSYKSSRLSFNSETMILQLYPNGDLFPLDNIGSASNYMFLHLCFFLGFHEHLLLNTKNEHIPEFLFIDQPSQPYLEGGNDDRMKILDAFNLLNQFLHFLVEENDFCFQILLVEHASKSYWIDNNLDYFHTVDEFVGGKGLIPTEIFNG